MASQDDASTVSDFTEYTQDEDDNSYLASQASTTDSDKILRRNKPKANEELWSHTRKAKGSEEVRNKHYQQIYYCKHCTSYKGSPNAERFRTHLKSHGKHVSSTPPGPTKIAFNNTIADIFGGQKTSQEQQNLIEEKTLQAAIKVPEFKEACARLITVRNLPCSLLDWPEFWAVILSVNYMAKESLKFARQDVPKLIESTYILHREELVKKLKNSLSLIHFSIDMWTSPAKTGFQAIVVHWVDAETRCGETALLSLKEFKGAHGGKEQAEVFLRVIREAGLQDQLGFFTSDNHGSNDLMLRRIAEEIENFDPVLRRVRCFGHNLNRVAQAFLFGSTAKRGEGQKDEDEAIEIAIQDMAQLQDEL
jgi:hypothetical protein